MATINHGSGADIIVPSNNGTTYRGLAGDDTYIISNSIAANAAITIVDTSGANKIQLVDGLSVSSSKFAADAVQLTLSNGAVVTINGASNFTFDVGGNATTGTSGSSNTLRNLLLQWVFLHFQLLEQLLVVLILLSLTMVLVVLLLRHLQ